MKFRKTNEPVGEKRLIEWSTILLSLLSLIGWIYFRFFFKDDTEEKLLQFLESPKVSMVEGHISNFTRTVEQKKYATVTFESFKVDSLKFTYDEHAGPFS